MKPIKLYKTILGSYFSRTEDNNQVSVFISNQQYDEEVRWNLSVHGAHGSVKLHFKTLRAAKAAVPVVCRMLLKIK